MVGRIEAIHDCTTPKSSLSSCRDEGMITDKTTRLEGGIDETLQWLDSNFFAETEEHEVKKKDVEGIAIPVLKSIAGAEPNVQAITVSRTTVTLSRPIFHLLKSRAPSTRLLNSSSLTSSSFYIGRLKA